MNLLPTLTKLYPENSWGGQCFQFCHKLISESATFPGMPVSLTGKRQVLAQYGIPINKVDDIKVGDVLLFDYGYFGHGAVVNRIVGDTCFLTESNYNLNFKVHHTRSVSKYDPHILGVFRSKWLFKVVYQIKLVHNGKWGSYAEKFKDILDRITQATEKVSVNIDVDYVTLTTPFTSTGYPTPYLGADLNWYNQNILPHKGSYDIVCYLDNRFPALGQTFGWHSGTGQIQVYSNETDTITFPSFGTVNYFVHACLHELAHCIKEEAKDDTHTYFNDSQLPAGQFNIKGFFDTL